MWTTSVNFIMTSQVFQFLCTEKKIAHAKTIKANFITNKVTTNKCVEN
jgi:hypothetical protein